ncbi:SpoIVB peptidase [Clostridium tarantellae]|uniref:SpoIVB peptidase n=1 Tax=Clostridium tarantellae TaxID=39493 RepID=A0A6I1MKU9_9CLOT|nr:SpoIVB peptidase [Clostridium tarantellae]MPQ42747.1 SpoIVB peptidase [Clostridium tarantellae]
MNFLNEKKIRIFKLIIFSLLLVLSSIFIFSNEINCLAENVSTEVSPVILNNTSKHKEFKNNYGVLEVNNILKSKDIELYPGGIPIGVKISTEGVLAVGYSQIELKDNIIESSAKESGIEVGDILLKFNGKNIENSKDLARKLNDVKDKNIKILINRNGKELEKNVEVIIDSKGNKKIGLWVRDSTAGVGTLTFYHENTNKYGALGHPITDSETDKILNVKKGDLIESVIKSVRKGEKGLPGELKGIFINENTPIGNVTSNTSCGIFGEMKGNKLKSIYNKPYKVGKKEDIKLGPAKIISTVDENGPEMYDIEIIKLLSQTEAGPKSMVIKVVDKKLLEKTGGIVQGMSGSPIIQNDKIIGAVTHVLVNKPDTGYGIYIEWMLKDSNIIK